MLEHIDLGKKPTRIGPDRIRDALFWRAAVDLVGETDWVVERIKHKPATTMMVRTRDNTMVLATQLADRDFRQGTRKATQIERLCALL